MRDQIYRQPTDDLVDFVFDERVVNVFPDMIRRSVPGYELVVAMTGLLAARYAQPNSCCYDLGASLGATSVAMQRQIRAPGVRIVAVDSAPAMIERAMSSVLPNPADAPPIELVCADLCTVSLANASVVAMNFTLQFVPRESRAALLQRICHALHPQGALLLAEKIASSEPLDEALHLDFKRANGYSELEIASKRSALEQVLVPDSIDAHVAQLHTAGFTFVHPWFRCLNWCAFIATP